MGFFDFFDEKTSEEKDLEDAYSEGIEEGRDSSFFGQLTHEFVDFAADMVDMIPGPDSHEWSRRKSWDAGYHEGVAQGWPDDDEDESEDVEYDGEDYDAAEDDECDDYEDDDEDEDSDDYDEEDEDDEEGGEPAPPPPPVVQNVKPPKKMRKSPASNEVSTPKSSVCPHCKKVPCDARIVFHKRSGRRSR